MDEYPLKRIFTWEYLSLTVAVSFGLVALQVPYTDGMWGVVQVILLVLSGAASVVWLFISFCTFPTVVRELAYAMRYSRRPYDIFFGWGGVVSAVLAVGALAWGITLCAL